MQNKETQIAKLKKMYFEIDQEVEKLVALHGERLKCGLGCTQCCVDELTVFEIEAENIRREHGDLLENQKPNLPGACAMLDENGGCRIYPNRPYVCRTQGLPLRWIDEVEPDVLAEMRDICPLNEAGEPIEELSESACWTIGPFEGRLAELQLKLGGPELTRISLRNIFQNRD